MSWAGYKTPRWRRLREKILRRDGYRCREWARYGRAVQADTVHHVWPVEDWPEFAWREWNLISLCQAKHNEMHNRTDGRLTPIGESWMRRVSPPTSEVPVGDTS